MSSFEQLMRTPWEVEYSAALEHARRNRSVQDLALLMFTSGTTSEPKGVLHSHQTLDFENHSMITALALEDRECIFMPSPVTHVTGLLYGVLLPGILSGTVVLQDIWDPTEALELISRERCTFSVAATPFLTSMIHHPKFEAFDVTSMRSFACGGADVPPELIREASVKLCPTFRVYGSTEFPTVCISSPTAPLDKRATTDGRPFGHVAFEIVSDDGTRLPIGQIGELRATGPELFTGYLNVAESPFLPDGKFATGDLASLDADGYLTIRGRAKDIILRGGENISAKEVEDLLYQHPAIAEVAIVAYRDPIMTERACAVIVPRSGTAPTLDDVCEYLKSLRISPHKLPERLELVASLPKTASGKVQKFKLRELINS